MDSSDARRVLIPQEPPPAPRYRPVYRARSECRSAFTYLLRYALAEPRDAAYALPRRAACRLLGRHNATCRGRPDHPRKR